MDLRFCNYNSDVTSTFPANGKFTPKQKAIYDIVLLANTKSINSIKPGISTYPDLDYIAKYTVLQGLQDLDIIYKTINGKQVTIEELYQNDAISVFMSHGVGHYVGA